MKKLLIALFAITALMLFSFGACIDMGDETSTSEQQSEQTSTGTETSTGEETSSGPEIPETFTVTIAVNDDECGSVSISVVESVPYGTAVIAEGNVITVGTTEITAVKNEDNAEYSYEFVGFTGYYSTVTDDMEITANFTRTLRKYTVTFNMDGGTLSDGENANVTSLYVPYGTPASALDYFTKTRAGYLFDKWQYLEGETYVDLPQTAIVTGDITVKAVWTALEYVYGNGIDVSITGAVRNDICIEEGTDAGKYYAQASWAGGRSGTFGVYASAAAGLKANTAYFVFVNVEVDGNWPAFFSENNFYFGAPGGELKISVTTDENGAFAAVYDVYYNQGTYANITSISYREDLGSVYGEGISLSVGGNGVSVSDVFIEEGAEAGKYYTRATTSDFTDVGTYFTVSASAEAGLKANTTYRVSVYVGLDGSFPGFHDYSGSIFVLGAPGGNIVFDITTDENGAFTKEFGRVSFNCARTCDFTSVTMIENKGSVYGEGVVVNLGGGPITGCDTAKMYTEGEKAGYTRTYATTSGYGTNVGMSVELIGHKANTKYNVYLTIETDGSFPAFMGPGDCFVIGSPSGNTNTVLITTDASGYGAYSWNGCVSNQGSYFDVTGVTVEEVPVFVYGEGIDVTITGAVRNNIRIEEGTDAGKYYAQASWAGGRSGTFGVYASAAAGLKANTAYFVFVNVEVDGNWPAFFSENNFYFGAPGGELKISVTTDENGAFAAVYDVYYNQGTYANITSISYREDLGSVYGEGISLSVGGNGVSVSDVFIEEGAEAGKYYTRATTSDFTDVGTYFTVSASAEAGLKANTTYRVSVYVGLDGSFPGFHDYSGSIFVLGAPGGNIVFDITTDENGAFTKEFGRVSFNCARTCDFTSVTMIENKGSVYGEGVVVNLGGGPITGCDTAKMYTEGEKAGYTRTYATANGSANCGMSVELIGHKANTTYTVYLTIETDGAFPAFIGPGDCFIISSPSGNTNTVDITTDANGYGAYSWNGIYAQNATYFDVVGASVSEKTPVIYDVTQFTSVWNGQLGDCTDWFTLGATSDGNQYVYSWGAVGTTYVGLKFNLKLGANPSWLFISFGAPDNKNAHINGSNGVMLCISAESHKGCLINRSAGFTGIDTGYDFSEGGEYLIEVGVIEAGHYYFKVNGTLVQEFTDMEACAGSYLNITSWDGNTQVKTAN